MAEVSQGGSMVEEVAEEEAAEEGVAEEEAAEEGVAEEGVAEEGVAEEGVASSLLASTPFFPVAFCCAAKGMMAPLDFAFRAFFAKGTCSLSSPGIAPASSTARDCLRLCAEVASVLALCEMAAPVDTEAAGGCALSGPFTGLAKREGGSSLASRTGDGGKSNIEGYPRTECMMLCSSAMLPSASSISPFAPVLFFSFLLSPSSSALELTPSIMPTTNAGLLETMDCAPLVETGASVGIRPSVPLEGDA